jgi:flagellar motor switch protein FliG
MMLKGIQKAALLLTTLDSTMATEMLKGQSPEVIQKIAMELAQMDAHGVTGTDQVMVVGRDFCNQLQKNNSGNLHVKGLVSSLLQNSAGKEKASEIMARMEKTVRDNDPFINLSAASSGQLAAAIKGESPQTIALILSGIPPKLASDVLSRLEEQVSTQVAWRLTLPQSVSPKTLQRIGETICKKLQELNTEQSSAPADKEDTSQENLRRVAVVLSGLQKERRNLMLQQIKTRSPEIAETVKALMVTWDDIPKIDNKCFQGLVRKMEADILAKALFGADAVVSQKIRSNISERLAQMIAEETNLLGEPKKKDVLAAREEVSKVLREANEADELIFTEEAA